MRKIRILVPHSRTPPIKRSYRSMYFRVPQLEEITWFWHDLEIIVDDGWHHILIAISGVCIWKMFHVRDRERAQSKAFPHVAEPTLSLSLRAHVRSLFSFSSRVSRSCGESSSSSSLLMLLGHVASNMLPAHRWLVSWRFAHFGLSFLSFWHLRRRELGLNCYQTLNDLQLSIELLPDKSCRRLPLATRQR